MESLGHKSDDNPCLSMVLLPIFEKWRNRELELKKYETEEVDKEINIKTFLTQWSVARAFPLVP